MAEDHALAEKNNNIVYIVNSLNLGGTENLVVQMSRAFQAEYTVSVICLDEPGLWAQKLRDEGIAVYCFWRQPGIDLAMAGKIARYCKKHKIGLIHAHQCTPWFYAALSRVLYPSPRLLFEEHGRHYPERYSWKKNIINRWFIQKLTTKIVAVSADVRQRLVKYEGVAMDRIEVVYNGVHPPSVIDAEKRATLRQKLGFALDDFVVGTVGRLDPIKNLPMFLQVFAQAQSQHKKLKGLLVGDGPEFNTLSSLRDQLKVTDDVIMTGYRQDAIDLLQCMDLFVLCSLSEGTSMALLEAMASEIPTIVTAVGGNPELITHGKNGWVIPSESPRDLHEAIMQAYGSNDMRTQRAQAAKKDFEDRFSFIEMINTYHRLYHEIFDTRGE